MRVQITDRGRERRRQREQYDQRVLSVIESRYTSQDIYPEYRTDVAHRAAVNASKPDEPYLFPYAVAMRLIVILVLMALLYLLYGSRQVVRGPQAYDQPYHLLYYLAEVVLAAVGAGYMIRSVRKRAR